MGFGLVFFLVKSTSKYHLQGVALLVLGIFLEYVFDDSHLDHANEPWSKYTNSVTKLIFFRRSFPFGV